MIKEKKMHVIYILTAILNIEGITTHFHDYPIHI